MEKIKQFIDNGELELATMNGTNPEQMYTGIYEANTQI